MSDELSPVNAEDLDTQPREVTATMRGVTYRFREITMRQYEKLLKQAEVPNPNGRGTMTDNVLLLKLLVMKSMVEPVGMTVQQLQALPMPVGRKINEIVNDMHYGDEVTDEEAEAEAALLAQQQDGDDDEGEVEIPVEDDVTSDDGPLLISPDA